MRRALGVALLGSAILLLSPAAAFAHADVVSSTPRNGAQVRTAPSSITITFSEAVTLDGAEAPSIVNGADATIPSTATLAGSRLTVTPKQALARGRYAVTWHVISDDGHSVSGAIAFTVGPAGPRGRPTAVTTSPAVRTVLSGNRAGPLTVTVSHSARSGTITWTTPALPEPITWRVIGNGPAATATGVLPISGPWTMQATLEDAHFAVLIVNGTVQVKP